MPGGMERATKLLDKFNTARMPDIMMRPNPVKPRLEDIRDSMGEREVRIAGKRDAMGQAQLLKRDMNRSRKRMRYGF